MLNPDPPTSGKWQEGLLSSLYLQHFLDQAGWLALVGWKSSSNPAIPTIYYASAAATQTIQWTDLKGFTYKATLASFPHCEPCWAPSVESRWIYPPHTCLSRTEIWVSAPNRTKNLNSFLPQVFLPKYFLGTFSLFS